MTPSIKTLRVQPAEPPHGKRTLDDVVSLIKSCVQRIRAVEGECPSEAEYQAALKAEQEAGHELSKRIRSQVKPFGGE